jgi:hypothetical protein
VAFDLSKTRRAIAATSSVALAALLIASPARADGDMWNSMLGWVGLGHKQASPDDGTIDYTPRPALVVPPKMDLPPPQTATATPQNWPHDPDAAARARADADSRRPAPTSDSSSDPSPDFNADADKTTSKTNSKTDQEVSCSGSDGKGVCFYGPSGLIDLTKGFNMGGLFTSHPEDTSTLRIGSEPPREYLTQPPPGYQIPKLKGEDGDDDEATGSDSDSSNVDVGAPRHHHHHDSDDSSASNQ